MNCPYCGDRVSDACNGGDPGDWWDDEHFPDGECEAECDNCSKTFRVIIDWCPSFEAEKMEDD